MEVLRTISHSHMVWVSKNGCCSLDVVACAVELCSVCTHADSPAEEQVGQKLPAAMLFKDSRKTVEPEEAIHRF